LVTTSSPELHEQVILRRQFGEDLRPDRDRDYVSRVQAGNEKLSAIQAAFARCQLERLDDYAKTRDANVRALLDRLAALPGLVVPTCPPDREHAWHILRFPVRPARRAGRERATGSVPGGGAPGAEGGGRAVAAVSTRPPARAARFSAQAHGLTASKTILKRLRSSMTR
jgi:dTDP-4-amino-4,6-dideoxygalactose transaminase